MSRKQLIALFLCIVIHFTAGGAFFPLLPVYLARLGVDPAASGLYFTLGFMSVTVGALSAGWISDRFQRRRETIFVGALLSLPLFYFMGQVHYIIPLTVLTVFTWFIGGLIAAIVNIIAGMYAEEHERGRVFGVITMGVGIGGVIGGFAGGAIVDRWDFTTLFTVVALSEIVLMAEVFLIEDKKVALTSERQQAARIPFMTLPLWSLFIANVLQAAAGIGVGLSRPLAMNAMGLSATSISSTNAIASLATLPLPFAMGWASDRLGRKPILIGGFALSIVGGLILLFASSLWQFWLSTILMTAAGTAGAVATALVTDLTPPEALGTALARFGATVWIGGGLGFTLGGLVIANMGITASFAVTVGVAVASTLLVSLIRTRKPIAAKAAPAL